MSVPAPGVFSEKQAGLRHGWQAEKRRQRVLEMLRSRPGTRLALFADAGSDCQIVIVTVALAGLAIFEIAIPRGQYDGFALLDLVRSHFGDRSAPEVTGIAALVIGELTRLGRARIVNSDGTKYGPSEPGAAKAWLAVTTALAATCRFKGSGRLIASLCVF